MVPVARSRHRVRHRCDYVDETLVREVTPLGNWLEQESRLNAWGARLTMAGMVPAAAGMAAAVWHLGNELDRHIDICRMEAHINNGAPT